MNTQDIRHLISLGESLTTEFKSDLSKLPDNDLVAAIVGLANTQGGYLIVGIEDNGKITGLHKKHQNMQGLASLIASRTVPSLSVKTEQITVNSLPIAIIYVPSSNTLVATSDGLIQRRRLKADGSPESIPFHPNEFMQRQSTLGVIDPSAIPMMDISSDALDPLQRQRLRNAIKRYGGDNALAALDDEQLDGALRLVIEVEGNKHPTLTGLLF